MGDMSGDATVATAPESAASDAPAHPMPIVETVAEGFETSREQAVEKAAKVVEASGTQHAVATQPAVATQAAPQPVVAAQPQPAPVLAPRPTMASIELNRRAASLFDRLVNDAAALRVAVHSIGGATVVDLGIDVAGGLEAGRRLAEICLAGYGDVSLAPPDKSLGAWPTVVVRTDRPLESCLFSQYAGQQISRKGYFAMGSGPMRAACGSEVVFTKFGYGERSDVVVGVLETRTLPTVEVVNDIAAKCGVAPGGVRLCVAPTASLAGTLQVVARSIETALHKLHELGFDLRRLTSAFGSAPLPPIGKNDMASLGRTNDAILYGGDVTLWVTGDDASIENVGPRVPASSSKDYGRPFAEIFEQYDRDFYKIDPLLFSPAVVGFLNLDTGRSFRYGETNADVLRRSFHS